jgi:alpha-D-ribose 1-methylphosphonate 5-triphosphate synthase subunit PhnG
VIADDAELARALAILDAIFAARFPGWDRVEMLIESGVLRCAGEDRRRRMILAATRVDFAMLNNTENDDDES